MNHRYTAAVVLGGLLILPVIACVSTGKKVDASRVAKLVDGKTTKAQVLKMFGKPSSYTTRGKTGRVEIWVWSYGAANPLGAHHQTLRVTLNDKGIVESHAFSEIK